MDILKDDLHRLFLRYLIPSIGGAVVTTLYSFVDTIAIGQGVGPNGTAACAIFLGVFCIADFFALLCGIGGSVLMSKARGAGSTEKGNAYYTASVIYLLFVTVPVWAAVIIFQEPLYRMFGANEVLMPYALEYGTLLVYTFPVLVLPMFFASFIRNDGAPRFVLITTIIGAVINMVGDWLFVFPMNMGIFGASLATMLGSAAQVVLFVGYLFTKRCSLKFVRPYQIMPAVRKISANGFATAVASLATLVVTMIMNNQIMRYSGEAMLAVYGMIGIVAALFLHIYSGIGQAAQPIASSNYGAGESTRCWGVYRLGMITTFLFGGIFTIVCLAFPTEITRIFMKATPEVLEIAPYAVRVYALSFFGLGIATFVTLYLQSVMQPKMATFLSVLRGVVLNSILLYVLPLFLKADGIWWAIFATETITALIALVYMAKFKRKDGEAISKFYSSP